MIGNTRKSTNISAYQIIFILFLSRMQTFLTSVVIRQSFQVETSDIFITFITAFVISFIVWIPESILLRKHNHEDILTCSQKILPKYVNFIPVLFAICFFSTTVANISSIQLFLLSYFYNDTSIYIILGLIAVVAYSLYMGMESILRASTIIFVAFIAVNFLIVVLLIPNYQFDNLGPILMNDLPKFFHNSSMIAFSTEMVALMMLANRIKEKSQAVFFLFQLMMLIMGTIMFLSIILSMGVYANAALFPIYNLCSMVNVRVLERIESLYIIFDIMIAFIRVCLYMFLGIKCISSMTKPKFKSMIIPCYSILVGIVSIILFLNTRILKFISELNLSYIVLSILIIGVPLFLLLVDWIKKFLSTSNKLTFLVSKK